MGTWSALVNQPSFNPSTMLLLTDGRVICQADESRSWWALTPDGSGSYEAGSWSPIAQTVDDRRYFASAVLRDGRVIVAGGEQSTTQPTGDINSVEIYDPVADAWSPVPPPAGWSNIGDAPCCLLSDGRLLLGSIKDTRTAIYDPTSAGGNPWTAAGGGGAKADASSEETWTLLRDGSVLTVDCTDQTTVRPSKRAQRYVPAQDAWVDAGATIDPLVDAGDSEIGPALLLTDGRVFAVGATGATGLFTPPHHHHHGSAGQWRAGPNFPAGTDGLPMVAEDAPGVLLPSGRVLCCVGLKSLGLAAPGAGPTVFFEFDPETGALARVPDPLNAAGMPWSGRLLLLPNGQVLYAKTWSQSSTKIAVYSPDGRFEERWRPVITSAPHTAFSGATIRIHGRRFNGMSQAVSYGDDATAATNYPLVRLRNRRTGAIVYARTSDHSTMAVATNDADVSTSVELPIAFRDDECDLVVIANGIPSEPRRLILRSPHHLPWEDLGRYVEWQRLFGSLADGPLWSIDSQGHVHPVPGPWPERLVSEMGDALKIIGAQLERIAAIGDRVVAERAVNVEKESRVALPPARRSAGPGKG